MVQAEGDQVEATVAYSPQQNGVAERFNRTLVEKVRSMLFEANAPKRMWCEAVYTGVYLINRSPTTSLKGSVTPAEMWYGVKPDVSKLRIFGCKAYAWIPSQQRKKMDSKSRKSIMIGYVQNGYRLWDQDKQRIFIARDVKFDEDCFPFEKESNSRIEELNIVRTNNPDPEGNDENVVCRQEQEGDGVMLGQNDEGDDVSNEVFEDAENVHSPDALPSQEERMIHQRLF